MAAPLAGGRYRLQTTLSATPMAEVWIADDTELERRVVVKLLAPGADRERFEREARAVAALAHPNIVRLFDFGDERRPYMIFECLTGGSLEDKLAASGALRADEIERIDAEVAAGLAHAHDHGVVHRDLKPGNILFDAEGRAKIGDFGIARVQGSDTLTDAGTVLGTASHISPEQVRGEPATPASDVYSFGVILYRLLAGRLPFEAESPTELARLHRDEQPPPLGTVGNERLAAVAMSALAKDPKERPADGTALLARLEATAPADVAATARLVPLASPSRRRVPFVAAAVAALLAACGVFAAVVLTSRPASAPAVPPQTSHPAGRRAATTTAAVTTSRTSTRTTSPRTATSARPKPKTASTRPAATVASVPLTVPATNVTTTPAPTTVPATTVATTTAGP